MGCFIQSYFSNGITLKSSAVCVLGKICFASLRCSTTDTFSYVVDTRECKEAFELAKGAKLLLCEATYLNEHKNLAYEHHHLTASQAAHIAKKGHAKKLVLTHFSSRYQSVVSILMKQSKFFPTHTLLKTLKLFRLKNSFV